MRKINVVFIVFLSTLGLNNCGEPIKTNSGVIRITIDPFPPPKDQIFRESTGELENIEKQEEDNVSKEIKERMYIDYSSEGYKKMREKEYKENEQEIIDKIKKEMEKK